MQIGLHFYKYVCYFENVFFLIFILTFFIVFKCNCSEDAFSQDACFISAGRNDYFVWTLFLKFVTQN